MSACRPIAIAPGRGCARGFSLLELVVALVLSVVLLSGMTGAIMVATRAAEVGAEGARGPAVSRDIVEQITRDVHLAYSFSERTDAAITFEVPDRDGDLLPETIRYAWDGVRGVAPGTITRAYNGGAPAVLATDVKDLRLLYAYRTLEGAPPDGGGTGGGTPLLLVVGDADSPSSQDMARRALVQSWGYDATLVSASASPDVLNAAVSTSNVVYVALQGGSEALGTKLRNSVIGIVVEEMALHDEFGFCDDRASPPATDTIDITSAAHHITAPFAPGDVVIMDASQPASGASGGKAVGLVVLGKTPGNDPNLAVIETGDALYGGGMAADRRVLLPWGQSGFDVAALNDNGRTILARSLEWAAGGGPAGDEHLGYPVEFSTPVSFVHEIQIATQVTLTESGTVTSVSAFVGGSAKQVRYAIYTDSGGEPGALIVESTQEATGVADAWITIPVLATALAPGDYWLALSFEREEHRYHQQAPGETRYRYHDARKLGYLPTWGASDDSFSIAMSIYATYTPD